MELKKQLSLRDNGGVYYEGTRVTPVDDAVLFVGLGGTGIDALLRVKNEVQSRMPLPKGENGQVLGTSPNNIAFLAIDTDKEKFKSSWGVASFDPSGNECLQISVDGLSDVIKHVQQMDADKEEWKWLDRELPANGGVEGANGVRQVGRFMLFQNINKIEERVKSVFSKLEAAVKNISTGMTDTSKGFKIFITGGIGGGTGSGTFIDIAYILRQIAADQNIPNVQVLGYLFTPDLNKGKGGDPNSMYRNGFAFLKELDYWMAVNDHGQHFVQKYSGRFSVNRDENVFNYCHLVTARDADHKPVSYDEAMASVGSTLFSYIVSEPGSDTSGNTALSQMYDNIEGHINASQKTHPANYRYLSVGADRVEIPYTEITTLVAARVFEKLEPTFMKQPDKASFDADRFALGLNYNQLESYIQRDMPANPLATSKFSYGDIWPSNSVKARVDSWLIATEKKIRDNKSNFSSVFEKKFKDRIEALLKDPSFGPCYVEKLIFSNTNECLIKTLEGVKQDCAERLAGCTQREGAIVARLQQAYAAGQNAGLFGKGKATEEYLEVLKMWANVRYCYWMYYDLIDALTEFIERLNKYHAKVFKNLADVLRLLPDIFRDNVKYIMEQENEANKHPEQAAKYLVRPVEFEKKFKETIVKKVEESTKAFFQSLRANIKTWIGVELDEIDSDIMMSTDVGGAIARFINDNFSTTLTMNMESLILDKLSAGDNPDQHIRQLLNNLKASAVPMFNLAVSSGYNLDTKEISLVSVPKDCDKILANAREMGNDARPRKSAELSKLQWVKVLVGMPLYSFPEVAKMEEFYELAMKEKNTRQGVHLLWEWREELPSPLPESTWTPTERGTAAKAYSQAYNDAARAAFDKCYKAGIIRMLDDQSGAMLYIADERKLENLELHGSIAEKKAQLDMLRMNLWSDPSTTIKLNAFGNASDKTPVERVCDNIIRFYNIVTAIKKQAEVLDKFDSLSSGFANVEFYVNALFANLIYEQGFDIKFRKSELDYSPVKQFDKMSSSPYVDYEIYKAFCGIVDGVRSDISAQFDRARMALLGADGNLNAEAVDAKAAALNATLTKMQGVLATLTEQISRTPMEQRGALVETMEFYSKSVEIINDRLRAIGK